VVKGLYVYMLWCKYKLIGVNSVSLT